MEVKRKTRRGEEGSRKGRKEEIILHLWLVLQAIPLHLKGTGVWWTCAHRGVLAMRLRNTEMQHYNISEYTVLYS